MNFNKFGTENKGQIFIKYNRAAFWFKCYAGKSKIPRNSKNLRGIQCGKKNSINYFIILAFK